jgi:peptidyl-prolyl cis-trans isomerase D
MFDAVRNNKRIAQAVLLVICLPFVFFGLDAYLRRDPATSEIARVGNAKITLGAFQAALRDEQSKLRQQNPAIDSAKLDSPALRTVLLNRMIDEAALNQEVHRLRLVPDAEALRRTIAKLPYFQKDGKFSPQLYERFLNSRGLPAPQFEALIARDTAWQTLGGALGDAAFMPETVKARLVAEKLEERTIAQSLLPYADRLADVSVDEAEAKKYYDENHGRFTTPERVKVQYLVFSQDALAKELAPPTSQQVEDWYKSHLAQYSTPETRHARHILLTGKNAEQEAKELSATLKKDPSRFAELAKEKSQDPGSAAKGGDLGDVVRGDLLPEFSNVLFALKAGEISAPVHTQFGWHVIEATQITPAKPKPLAQVQGEIEATLRLQQAQKRFNETVNDFSNRVYEDENTLSGAAQNWKLPLQESGWLTRSMPEKPEAAPAGSDKAIEEDPRFIAAIFKDDVLKDGHNSETVQISPTVSVAARVTAHEKAALQPFEQVKAQIEGELRQDKARAKVIAEGKALLGQCEKGAAGCKVAWEPPQTLSRLQSGSLAPAALNAVFDADAAKLPAYVGVPLATGYGIFKIEAAKPGKNIPQLEKIVGQQLDGVESQSELAAWLAAVKARYGVKRSSDTAWQSAGQ